MYVVVVEMKLRSLVLTLAAHSSSAKETCQRSYGVGFWALGF